MLKQISAALLAASLLTAPALAAEGKSTSTTPATTNSTTLKAPDSAPMDLVALDAAWEEEEVRFGPGAQGQGACGHEGLIAKLRHARRAVDPTPSSLQ